MKITWKYIFEDQFQSLDIIKGTIRFLTLTFSLFIANLKGALLKGHPVWSPFLKASILIVEQGLLIFKVKLLREKKERKEIPTD